MFTKTSRARNRAAALYSAIPLLAGLHLAGAADVSATWLPAANGTWNNTANWNSAFFPNNGNGGMTYSALIGATGPAYTVTLNNSVTVNDLSLTSPNATLNLTGGTLSVVASPINIAAGTLSLAGG